MTSFLPPILATGLVKKVKKAPVECTAYNSAVAGCLSKCARSQPRSAAEFMQEVSTAGNWTKDLQTAKPSEDWH